MIMQIPCLFKEFDKPPRKNSDLRTNSDTVSQEYMYLNPREDASKVANWSLRAFFTGSLLLITTYL